VQVDVGLDGAVRCLHVRHSRVQRVLLQPATQRQSVFPVTAAAKTAATNVPHGHADIGATVLERYYIQRWTHHQSNVGMSETD